MLECSIKGCNNTEENYRKMYTEDCAFNKVLCKKHYEALRLRGNTDRTVFDKNDIEIHSDYCKMYLYNRDGIVVGETLFDIEFLHDIRRFKWYMLKDKKIRYARARLNKEFQIKYNKKHIFLHQLILPCEHPYEPDHIDRDGLNNMLYNLRRVTRRGNCENRSTNTSGYIGVSWHKYVKKWHSTIKVNNKNIHIGYFDDAKDAGEAREKYKKENNII